MDRPWYQDLTRYHWWILIAAALGWLFDTMDQRIFTLCRGRALTDLETIEMDREELRGLTVRRAAGLLHVFPGARELEERLVEEVEEPAPDGRTLRFIVLPPNEETGGRRRFPFELLPEGRVRLPPTPVRVNDLGGIATALFIIGWATGGLFFGIIGDKWGRAFTMMITILVYSVFTGLSALSVNWIDFGIYRFLTGLGVGGEFAAGAALVAEVMPDRARPYALGLLQGLSAVGNIIGSTLGYWILPGWRLLFLMGILPALFVVAIRRRLKEPSRWMAVKESSGEFIEKRLGAVGDLFRVAPWRRHTIIGVVLAMSGVMGIWGIGFWTPELIRESVLKGLPPLEQDQVSSIATALQDVGAFFGIWAFSLLSQGLPRRRALPAAALAVLSALGAWLIFRTGTTSAWQLTIAGSLCVLGMFFGASTAGAVSAGAGRRAGFALSYVLGFLAIVMVFGFMKVEPQIYWMSPILGFSTLMVFGGYAVYFPELYPTRLRSTGTGFCYNVARYLAVGAPLALSRLGSLFTNHPGMAFPLEIQEPFRRAAVTVALVYFIGLAAVPFMPETRNRPMFED